MKVDSPFLDRIPEPVSLEAEAQGLILLSGFTLPELRAHTRGHKIDNARRALATRLCDAGWSQTKVAQLLERLPSTINAVVRGRWRHDRGPMIGGGKP